MRYSSYCQYTRTKNEMTQYYAASENELGVPIKIRVNRHPKYLPNAWDDLERSDRRMRSWKAYRRTQWK